ncbi:MAG: GUN4 domain-containing protein, partial [Phormidium sp.]
GRFGFSVQKRIYEEVGKDFQQLYRRVEWNSVRYIVSAPVGHFPLWIVRGQEKRGSGTIKLQDSRLKQGSRLKGSVGEGSVGVSGNISPVSSWLGTSFLLRSDL